MAADEMEDNGGRLKRRQPVQNHGPSSAIAQEGPLHFSMQFFQSSSTRRPCSWLLRAAWTTLNAR